MKWIRILLKTDVKEVDFIRAITVEGKRLCLVKSGDKFFVTQLKCPHAGANLSEGWCEDGKLICPYHRYSYDLETGRGAPEQGDYINTYAIEVRDDGIYVELPEHNSFLKKLFRL